MSSLLIGYNADAKFLYNRIACSIPGNLRFPAPLTFSESPEMTSLRLIFMETLKGKSLGRTLQNDAYAKEHLHGTGIDLGARSNQSSYYRFLKMAPDTRITFTDLHPASREVLTINLETDAIPVADDSQDFLILSNVLEHIYDYDHCVHEMARVLTPGGKLVGSVPFLVQVHPDPDDFFRYTSSSLHRIFSAHGFSKVRVDSLGYGPFSAAASFIAPILKFKPLVAVSYFAAMALDSLAAKIFSGNRRITSKYFPLAFFFVCEK